MSREKQNIIAQWISQHWRSDRKKVKVYYDKNHDDRHVEFEDLQDPRLEEFLKLQLFDERERRRR